ncbi:Pre-mRNA-splicing factor srp1 OS=Schizosaccharomyces pombe (strain 972 / ATCC 24843) GN=srp1 PE=1 SV=3 [Rhizoctonia solani AG-1 IB]|uniref:Pre-mRNA-splicing factor srp1 n=1 Tax=Thanatephorus cucumeris (strain AG1-IB / isolate 7/3/14) TaxID=1108050 RepID=A0A0B7FDG8_THACB|nr:Pre-mRNA-splicing factor srp1 OS=Schizosaccharomyces pombe (strain 972 / ATCC 24843) GN=srp1 PE=1 SV=3 [Rhizoctonia solani AG-1 IB]
MSGRKILFVSGFSRDARAKDLAYEFERYGRLVRCDIPSTRGGGGASYAFVEFRNDRDAEDAYHSMHGQMIDRHRVSVQWARRPPSALWRHDAPRSRGGRDRRDDRDRDRDRRDRDRSRSRSRSPRRDDKDKERDRDTRRRSRTRSRSRDRRDREHDEERDEPRTREDRDDVDEREDRHRRSLSHEPNGVAPADKEPEGDKKDAEPVVEQDK